MADAFQLTGACLGHVAHAFTGVDPRDRALAQAVIQAIGIATLYPQALRGTQLLALPRHCILESLPVGDCHPSVPLRGPGLEAFDHLECIAVAGLGRVVLIAGTRSRCQNQIERTAITTLGIACILESVDCFVAGAPRKGDVSTSNPTAKPLHGKVHAHGLLRVTVESPAHDGKILEMSTIARNG